MNLIIDTHSHLWEALNGFANGKEIKSIGGGKATFIDGIRQMMPPYMIDGKNTAEIFVSNMDYAGVAAAVVTQEYIDGNQNDYLLRVKKKYPDRFKICGLAEFRKPGFFDEVSVLLDQDFDAIKVPAQRLTNLEKRIYLNSEEMIKAFKLMEQKGKILSIDLADGDEQVGEMNDVIKECPKLKIAIGHFGMVTRPNWESQIKLARNKNVMIESGGITWLFHKEFYPYKGALNAIKAAADMVGMDKLMWGSDYPRTMTAITYTMSYDFISKSEELNVEDKEKVLGLNALGFYEFNNLCVPPKTKNMLED